MWSEPCAKLTIRVTPKISDRPADTRNSDAAAASPFRSWMMMEAKVTSGHEGDRNAFLPSEAGEVSASYADGGVMGISPVLMTPPPASRAPPHRGVRDGEESANGHLAGLISLISASDGRTSLPSTKRQSFM